MLFGTRTQTNAVTVPTPSKNSFYNVHTLRVCFHKLVQLVIDKQNGIRHCTTETTE